MNLFEYLEEIPWEIGTVIVVAVFALLTVISILLMHKWGQTSKLKEHHDVTGYVFANLGVLYSVLLAFTVMNVQTRFEKTKEVVQTEASYLAEIYRDTEVFDEKDRSAIRAAIKSYLWNVIHKEWPLLSTREVNVISNDEFKKIWTAYYRVEPKGVQQQAWFQESIGKLNLLQSARISRILGGKETLGVEMWSFLIIGGIAISLFVSLFGMENLYVHMLMGIVLSGSTAFLLFLIYSFDTAFSGVISVTPEAFIRVLNSLPN